MGRRERENLVEIEKRVLYLSPFVKEISVQKIDEEMIALIYPDFDAMKKHHIINIESNIKWYAVELYNLDHIDGIKLDGYRIVQESLSTAAAGEKKEKVSIDEPYDEVYREIKAYLQSVTTEPVCPASHLELDLGLDSLDYVMLFIFLEKSFGLHMDEALFAELMIVHDLYLWVYKHKKTYNRTQISWSDILEEKSREKLIYSPNIMMAWKIALLPFFKLYFRLEVTGRENLPSEPFIIAPTHYSMLDGFIVLATLPSPILKKSFFLAYEGEFGTPWLKPIAKYSQMLLIDIDKNLKASLQRTALPLIESQNLVLFPENARSRDGKLLEFKKFFAILSKEINAPIVPTLLQGTFEAMPAGKIFPKRTKVTIKYLKPVYPNGMSYDELSDRVKNTLRAELQ
ncbi:MAG: 1-acyl-sn-glycerol-3-phosphate acyltransferase [Campylobacterota bacterium]|nr:1-acyl-sn-glycerol-3-phosphate acyltransferase [Campylobacterota bacterium]